MQRSQNGGHLNFFFCVFELRWVEAAVRGRGTSGGGGSEGGGHQSLKQLRSCRPTDDKAGQITAGGGK